MQDVEIVFEDNDVIVVYKEVGIATQTARLGERDVVSELKNYLAKPGGSGEPYVGVVHRLDQPVEGLLVFAKTKRAAAELSRQAAGRMMEKYYYAVVMGEPRPPEGELKDSLVRDGQRNRSHVAESVREEGWQEMGNNDRKEASLHYRVMGKQKGISLLEVKLETGRHHQIRVQLSHAGMPLLGDVKYGTSESADVKYGTAESAEISDEINLPQSALRTGRNYRQLALCAGRLTFIHPVTKAGKSFAVKPRNPIFQVFSSFFTS